MKILVVDDEKLLVKGITFNLQNEGYEVEAAYDGVTAVDLARRESFDLIILDWMMPGKSGSEACMEIRTFSDVPVIMLTAKSEDSDKIMGFACGADDYVTKPFNIMELMAVLNMLGLYFGDILGTIDRETYSEMVRDLQRVPEYIEKILESAESIHEIAKKICRSEDVFFNGRNLDYALSLEGSLKLKEISYIHSEAYASGELKHGTISLIVDGTLVIALGTYGPLFDKAMSNVVEVQARGANVLALTTESHAEEMSRHVPMVMTIPDIHDMLLPQLGVVPLQLLAYYMALERGCDIDKPRNLAKSVTVE